MQAWKACAAADSLHTERVGLAEVVDVPTVQLHWILAVPEQLSLIIWPPQVPVQLQPSPVKTWQVGVQLGPVGPVGLPSVAAPVVGTPGK